MNTYETIIPGGSASGTITVPGDKSITIRAVLLSAIADGVSRIIGISSGGDVVSAIQCIQQLGIKIEKNGETSLTIYGNGMHGFHTSEKPLFCSNSGTTVRLLSGILAGQRHTYIMTGDDSLKKRPMNRVTIPLRQMGAHIHYLEDDGFLPYRIQPAALNGISFSMPVASAQVKSAVLLAGLYAQGKTVIKEPVQSRNHTEIMLAVRGVEIDINKVKNEITLTPPEIILPAEISIPGDISSAAFFIVLASLLPNSYLVIHNVGINPTRTGILDILHSMGADFTINNRRLVSGEETADIEVRSSELYGAEICGDIIPRIIDELPIIAAAGAFADGITVIKDAQELRVKETDRIAALYVNLQKMGTTVEECPDGLIIKGKTGFKPAQFESFSDHRIAMAFAVAAAVLHGESVIHGSNWADISFPGFFTLLNRVRGIIQ